MSRCTRSEGVHCLQIGCSAPNHKNKRGICETTADTTARGRTRYGARHPLWAAASDQKGCTAYGSGAAPPITRTNAESARRRPTQQREGAPLTGHCTRYGARHPLRGATPVMGRCTRSEGVHCLRIGCSAPNNKNKRGICETTADTQKVGERTKRVGFVVTFWCVGAGQSTL